MPPTPLPAPRSSVSLTGRATAFPVACPLLGAGLCLKKKASYSFCASLPTAHNAKKSHTRAILVHSSFSSNGLPYCLALEEGRDQLPMLLIVHQAHRGPRSFTHNREPFIWLKSQTSPSSLRSQKTAPISYRDWQGRQELEVKESGLTWLRDGNGRYVCFLSTEQSLYTSWNFLCQVINFSETSLKSDLISNKRISTGYL